MATKSLGICGLDEAGRGALAGPMVVAAVVLGKDFKFGDVAPEIVMKDSKQMSNLQREKAFQLIKKHSLLIELEIMTVQEINKMGVGWANMEAFKRLIRKIDSNQYIVDGRWRSGDLGDKTPLVQCMIDADEIVSSTMSAGIVAKYKHDQIMLGLHSQYSEYGWNTNTGHGTQQHIKAIHEYGTNEHHRVRFVETAIRHASERMKFR
ncbi:MAG: ribonuclease HII [Candidatus Levybacteria bacterium CG10_big_fil_rev_8_21_14_0_10_35_13]|nr:MAG: ribonuclease HII [Candidatus Levybacteria bacterium CG10_big_fil_rev_8_21_14_0_10_35_13]